MDASNESHRNHKIGILVPYGPWTWSSYWQTSEAQIALFRRLKAREIQISTRVDPALTNPDDFARLRSGDQLWVSPEGSVSKGLLTWLEKAHCRSPQSLPPTLLSLAGEGAKAGMNLASISTDLRARLGWVVSSNVEAALLQRIFGGKLRLFTIPLPVSHRFKPSSRLARRVFKQSLGMQANDPLIVYAGRLSAQKNILELIEVFARILIKKPRSRLYLLGQPDTIGYPHLGISLPFPYGELLSAQIERLGITQSVFFPGHLSQDKLRGFLASCDLHVSLTTHYGDHFGYSLAQGMACGAPTAITRWGGGWDFIRGKGALGIPVRNRAGWPEVDLIAAERIFLSLLQPRNQELARKRALEYAEKRLSETSVRKMWFEAGQAMKNHQRPQNSSPLPQVRRLLKIRKSKLRLSPDFTHPLFRSVRDPVFKLILSHYARGR